MSDSSCTAWSSCRESSYACARTSGPRVRVRVGLFHTLTRLPESPVFLPRQVYGTTADKLTVLGYCVFKGKSANCNAVIAFAVILWLLLIAVIVWHSLAYLGEMGLPHLIEAMIFAVATLGWLVVAIITAAGVGGATRLPSAIRAVQAFSWLNVGFHAGSAVVAFLHSKVDSGGGDIAPVAFESEA